MIKASFPLYQGDSWTRELIVSDMDLHVDHNRSFGREKHMWSEFPQLIIITNKSSNKIDHCPTSIMFNTLEEYEALYQKLYKLFSIKGYVWSLNSNEDTLCRSNILPLNTNHYWYDDISDSYFYSKFEESNFSLELQEKFKYCRSFDKYYMMSDSSRVYSGGLDAEKHLKDLLEGDNVATAYAMYVAGDPLFMFKTMGGKIKDNIISRSEAYELLKIIPSVPPVEDLIEYPKLIEPCKGFYPHPKKQGWHPNDLKYSGHYSNNCFIHEDEAEDIRQAEETLYKMRQNSKKYYR